MTIRSKVRQPSGGRGSHPAIAAMVEQIRRVPSVERILLFGSRARDDHDVRSDIDLAVACPEATHADWAAIWLIVDDAPTLLAVDLVRLEHAGDALRRRIEQEGLVLYERTKLQQALDNLGSALARLEKRSIRRSDLTGSVRGCGF